MKKLNIKIFTVIFSILSIFVLSILFIFNYQFYNREKRNIDETLIRLNNHRLFNKPIINNEPNIFIDINAYTVIINNKNIEQIINHTDKEIETDKILELVNNILKSNKNKKIGNLYFDSYSYHIFNNKIIIIDNSINKDRLISLLETSIVIFILLEIIIFIVTMKITKWIIKPVELSFLKQKQFISNASHELKTPLAVILANSEMIKETKTNEKWLNNIKSEAERMNKLVINLLTLAKVEEDILNLEEIELSKLVEKTILPFESLIYESNLKLEYNLKENIIYRCDVEQIKQLIVILLDNAIKHTDKNGKIIIDLYNIKNEIIIDIKNQGMEINKEDREKIFERFYRSDKSRNRDSNRYGLGLAIAKAIVENHKGKISVNYDKGYNIFKIVLK